MPNARISSGATVFFAIGDAVHPDARSLVERIGPDMVVGGNVVYLSDGGQQKDHFAIIDVEGVYSPLIVPVVRLREDHAEPRRKLPVKDSEEDTARASKTS